jgi:HEAT repeat protein
MDMKKTVAKSGPKEPRTGRADPLKSRRSFEWPLLIYPVLFLITLGILCLVNRSIQKELPAPVGPHQTAEQPAVTPEGTGHPDAAAGTATGNPGRFASGLTRRSPTSTEAAAGHVPAGPAPRGGRVTSKPGRASSIAGKMQHAVDLSQLQGSARTAALLRIAVDDRDHARIKQCLAELVALGDGAVVPLNDLLANEEGDTALWAATALARIGTPTATSALLDRLAETKEGPYKEELSKRVSSISNHDSWPLLLDTMMQAGDTTVVRAAGASLSMMADAPVIDEVIARYDAASTETEVDRLIQLVRNIHSPKATEPLLSLAGPVSATPQDSLQEAAIEALAKIGDAPSVSYLLRRLEASPPGESTQIFNAITQIDSPEAQASLLYAAAGNKEVSAEHGRTAAIYALKNFPDDKTMALLERIIAQEQNEKVLTAATRTLDNIRLAPHAIAAKADSLQKSEQMLPLPPLEK